MNAVTARGGVGGRLLNLEKTTWRGPGCETIVVKFKAELLVEGSGGQWERRVDIQAYWNFSNSKIKTVFPK